MPERTHPRTVKHMSEKYSLVDLFAGAGGLGLGLERAGFETVYVSELHPAALSTYLRNRPDSLVNLPSRHAGDLLEITNNADRLSRLAKMLRRAHGDIDLVAGGPPCQGYSGRAHRRSISVDKLAVPSNHLYQSMITFIEAVRPRMFLFENVEGILRGAWTSQGNAGEIWRDVYSAFQRISVKVSGKNVTYLLGCHLVKAYEYGVPQNRPRVLLVGVRSDLTTPYDPNRRAMGLLPEPTFGAPSPVDVLSDLATPLWSSGPDLVYKNAPSSDFQRSVRRTREGLLLKKGSPLSEQFYTDHSTKVIDRFTHLIEGTEIPASLQTGKMQQKALPRRWPNGTPTATMTSLPDDYVHYSLPRILTVREWARFQTFPDWYEFSGPRTTGGKRRAGDPSVGDWERELPKYTQIGNAVPVVMAEKVGKHLVKILRSNT